MRHGCLRPQGRWDRLRGIACRRLSGGMQRFEERHESGRLRRTQVLSIGGHVSPALDDLPDQLIVRQPDRDGVERRPTLAAVLVYLKAVRWREVEA